MLQSIVALDGSTLDFVPLAQMNIVDIASVFRSIDKNCLIWQHINEHYEQALNTYVNLYFIRKRCGEYVGYITFGGSGEEVHPYVAIVPKWRHQGYASAAVWAVCELYGEEPYVEVVARWP